MGGRAIAGGRQRSLGTHRKQRANSWSRTEVETLSYSQSGTQEFMGEWGERRLEGGITLWIEIRLWIMERLEALLRNFVCLFVCKQLVFDKVTEYRMLVAVF